MTRAADISVKKIAAGVFLGMSAFMIVWTIIGWLIAGFVIGAITFGGTGQSLEPPQDTRSALQNALDASSEAQRSAAEQRRAGSPTAQRLLHICAEWRRNARTTPTTTTEAERDRTCARYDRYIRTGSADP